MHFSMEAIGTCSKDVCVLSDYWSANTRSSSETSEEG